MIRQIKKILKIEYLLIKLNAEVMFEYRLDSLFFFIGSGLYNVGALLFITFLFSKIPLITGWDKWDLILLYGIGQIIGYIYFFATSPNAKSFIDQVQSGDFDFLITKPVNSLILSTLRVFSIDALFSLIQPAVIMGYAFANKGYDITLLGICIAIVAIIISVIIIHALTVITLIPTFWIIRNQFYRFFNETADLMNYPYEIFDGKISKFIFFFMVPYALLVNIPFRALIGKLDYRLFILQIFVCAVFLIVLRFLWKLGVRSYSSASS